MTSVVVTGAAGYVGNGLVEVLRKRGNEVYAIVRPNSSSNTKLDSSDKGLHVIEVDMDEVLLAEDQIPKGSSVFYHLAVMRESDFESQYANVDQTLNALKLATSLGCRRFVGIGSQAEYGIVPPNEITTEERAPNPISAYGASKVASCYLSMQLAREMGIEWVWGRVFSVLGKYEKPGRMLPDLCKALSEGRSMRLSSCRQNWDYIDLYDAAEAIIAIADRGVSGEIYNIANGDFRPLVEFTEELRNLIDPNVVIEYGDDPSPFISLQPSIKKIKRDTGWEATRKFQDSVKEWICSK